MAESDSILGRMGLKGRGQLVTCHVTKSNLICFVLSTLRLTETPNKDLILCIFEKMAQDEVLINWFQHPTLRTAPFTF
jgi:hypothetical protein